MALKISVECRGYLLATLNLSEDLVEAAGGEREMISAIFMSVSIGCRGNGPPPEIRVGDAAEPARPGLSEEELAEILKSEQ